MRATGVTVVPRRDCGVCESHAILFLDAAAREETGSGVRVLVPVYAGGLMEGTNPVAGSWPILFSRLMRADGVLRFHPPEMVLWTGGGPVKSACCYKSFRFHVVSSHSCADYAWGTCR